LADRVAADAGEPAQRALAGALANDLDANFECFVERYQHRLYAFVLTLVANAAEAEEVAQEAFVSAYGALAGYDAARRRSLSLRAWLFTIALNKVRNRSRRAPALALHDVAEPEARTADGPEASAERSEAVSAVRAALGELAPRYRMPVVLRHIEGLSYDEIAQVLDQPVGTAKANVHRGLALLRESQKIGALA
jgi:RNA polymerase sigma-70 factor, ECF subfamily